MPTNMRRYIAVDKENCLGCQNCVINCALAHADGDLQSLTLDNTRPQPRNQVVQLEGQVYPRQCQHCTDAKCIEACPIKAITREQGIVKIDEAACIGCKACAKACPFEAISMELNPHHTGTSKKGKYKALKCDLCYSRWEDDSKPNCACVAACPTHALKLMEINL